MSELKSTETMTPRNAEQKLSDVLDSIQWVINDMAYKAPEQINANMALRWDERLRGAIKRAYEP